MEWSKHLAGGKGTFRRSAAPFVRFLDLVEHALQRSPSGLVRAVLGREARSAPPQTLAQFSVCP